MSKGKETKKSDKIDCVDNGGQLNEGRKSNNLEEAKQESEDKN